MTEERWRPLLGCALVLVGLFGLGVGFWFTVAGVMARDWPAALGGLLVIAVVLYGALR